jgi:hypothetical protein
MVSFSALLLPPAVAQAADPRCVIRSAIAEAHTSADLRGGARSQHRGRAAPE